MNARVMLNRHFCDREPVHEGECGKESVHALEESDPLQHGTSEYLERAPGVVDAVMGKRIPHAVGDSGRQFLHQPILPLLPPSAHEIVGISIGEEFQDVFAVLLKVAVYLNDNVTERLIETRFERACLAIISIKVEDSNLGMIRRHTIQGLAAAVATAVVHEDEFERPGLRGRM